MPLPAVLGHEGAGVVEGVGEGAAKVRPGDHVALSFACCGRCSSCLRSKQPYCLTFFERNFGGARIDGSTGLSKDGDAVHSHFFGQSSFATYSLATEWNVVKVPDDAPLELLGPLGCGVQTGAGAVLNTLRPEARSSIAVFRMGTVGLSAIMAAVVGCTTIGGDDIKPGRLELAREVGPTHVVNGAKTDSVEEVRGITGGGVDYSLDSTGVPAVFRQAVDALSPLGMCGIVGAPPLSTEASLDMNGVMIPGKTMRGFIEGDSVPDVFIPRLIELHAQGRFPFDRLVRFYELDEINPAAEDAERGDTIKPVLSLG